MVSCCRSSLDVYCSTVDQAPRASAEQPRPHPWTCLGVEKCMAGAAKIIVVGEGGSRMGILFDASHTPGVCSEANNFI